MVVSVFKYLLDECGISSDWYWFEVYELGRVFGNRVEILVVWVLFLLF